MGLHLAITLIVSGVFSSIHQWLMWEVLDYRHRFLHPEVTFLNVSFSPAISSPPKEIRFTMNRDRSDLYVSKVETQQCLSFLLNKWQMLIFVSLRNCSSKWLRVNPGIQPESWQACRVEKSRCSIQFGCHRLPGFRCTFCVAKVMVSLLLATYSETKKIEFGTQINDKACISKKK